MNWTPEQEKAIADRGKNILVSAAAGSGKTALLIERIWRLVVEEGVDVDEILVLTFTRAAASEMRGRLSTALTKTLSETHDSETAKRVSRQIARLPLAEISTIHGFCGDVVRDFFQEAGVDPDFTIADETRLKMLKTEAMDDVFEARYNAIPDDGETGFSQLVDMFTGNRDDEALRDIVMHLREFLLTLEDPETFEKDALAQLNLAADDFPESTLSAKRRVLFKTALTQASGMLNHALEQIEDDAAFDKTADVLRADIAGVDAALAAVSDDAAFPTAYRAIKFGRFVSNKKDPDTSAAVKTERDAAKKIVQEMAAMPGKNVDELVSDLNAMAGPMADLLDLMHDFDKAFTAKKTEQGLMDFNDLEQVTRRILKNPAVADALRQRFSHIFVDEYQDTNAIQEAILTAIRRPDNYFCVGDVKQSIYRFRLADPGIFLDKYKRYRDPDDNLSEVIDLNRNFRSGRGVITVVNDLFEKTMSETLGEITYDDNAKLIQGTDDSKDGMTAELVLADASGGTDEQIRAQAAVIADKIHALVGQKIYIAKENRTRTLRYRDIGVLMRSVSGRGDKLAEALAEAGIPTYFDGGQTYFESAEITLMLNLIRVIDNYRQDEPLMAVMDSAVGGFTEEELALIRIHEEDGTIYFWDSVEQMAAQDDALGQKTAAFLDKIKRWREEAYTYSVSDFLWHLMLETDYYAMAGALPGGRQRQKNLRVLLTRAKSYQQNNLQGIFGFAGYVSQMDRQNVDMGAPSVLSENDDVVRVMTIHKSKGLEFPVVFIADIGHQFNRRDGSGRLLYSKDCGICPKYIDPKQRLQKTTVAYDIAQADQRAKSLSEEMRLLYVAMTRAEEKLYFVGSVKDFDDNRDKLEQKWQAPCDTYHLTHASCFLDWLMLAFYRGNVNYHANTDAIKIFLPGETADVTNQREPSAENENEIEESSEDNVALLEEIERRVRYRYPQAEKPDPPAKLSVTAVEDIRQGKNKTVDVPERLARPAFLSAEQDKTYTPAEMGTGIHTVMQGLDLKLIADAAADDTLAPAVESEANRMAAAGIIEADLCDMLDLSPIVRFFKTPLGKRLLDAKTVRREWPFNYRTTGQKISDDYDDAPLLLQGMIDCCFIENGKWILLDYKTDHWHNAQKRNAVLAHYQTQIDFYARALSEITEKPVAEKYLCFLTMGENIAR